MSKRNYKIERIDAILPNGSIDSVPAFYIKGDDELFRLFDFYNGRAPIKIIGTNSGYDNRLSYGSLQSSAFTGGFRPNFERDTGLLCILPEFAWEGYPPKTGEIQILYFPDEVELRQDYQYSNGQLTETSCRTKTICKLFFILFLVAITILLTKQL